MDAFRLFNLHRHVTTKNKSAYTQAASKPLLGASVCVLVLLCVYLCLGLLVMSN